MDDRETYNEETELVSRREILIAAGLFIEDPEADVGLTFPVPEGVKIKQLLTSYDTKRTTGRKVRCAACKTKTPHFRGFRAELDNGGAANIGIDCGEEISNPGVWQALSSGLSRRQDDAYYSARVGPTLMQLDKIKNLLPDWLGRINALADFHHDFPFRLRKELADTVRLGGLMQHDKTRKLSKTESKKRSGLRSEVYTKTYGKVPSPAFFGKHDWDGKARRSFRSISEIRDGIAYANGLPKLVAGFKALREFRKRMEDVHTEHEIALANLSLDWWASACHWANTAPQPEGIYRLEGRTIFFVGDYEDEKVWQIPTRAEIGPSLWPEVRELWPE